MGIPKTRNVNFRTLKWSYDEVRSGTICLAIFCWDIPNYVPLDPWSQWWTPQSIHECFTDLQQLFQTLVRFQAHWELQEPSCMDQLANRLCQWLHKGLWLEPTLRCCGTPQPNFENPMPHIVRQVAKLWAHKGHSKCGWGRPPLWGYPNSWKSKCLLFLCFLKYTSGSSA